MRSMLAVIALVAGFGLSAATQTRIDRRPPDRSPEDEQVYLRSGENIRLMSFGFNSLVADFYWIRTVLYFGGRLEEQRESEHEFSLRSMPLLEPLLRLTTEVDPHHLAAYRFGAFFLPYRSVDEAIEFTRRGIGSNPGEWRLYQDLGMIYWRAGRFDEASKAYAAGAALPGAPEWMKGMSATMAARGGDIETAREIFSRLYKETDDEMIRRICLDHLERIERESAGRRR